MPIPPISLVEPPTPLAPPTIDRNLKPPTITSFASSEAAAKSKFLDDVHAAAGQMRNIQLDAKALDHKYNLSECEL